MKYGQSSFVGRKGIIVLVALALILSSACNVALSPNESALKKVSEVRLRYASNDIASVYKDASERFRQSTNKEQFVDVMGRFHEGLGNESDFELSEWKSYAEIGATYYILRYTGRASSKIEFDEFVFVATEKGLLLDNYRFDLRDE